MNVQEILSATLSKAEKARRLYDLGLTRHQVADMICGGNYGWAHNIYKKHFGLETTSRSISNTFSKEFGVEIEAFGIDRHRLAAGLNAAGIPTQVQSYNHTTCNTWKIVTDSSIRATSAFEIVSPILKGESGLSLLQKVCQVLVDLGAKINKTCGLHIHFNASSLSISDWKNLFKNYINLEAEIDNMLPLSRRANNNTYCKSLMNNFSSKASAFTAIDHATTVNQLSQAISDNSRYYKLNAESYMRHGTVEFRQHSGTIEFDKIGNWVRICSAMIDKSKFGLADSLHQFLPDNLKTYIRQRSLKLRA